MMGLVRIATLVVISVNVAQAQSETSCNINDYKSLVTCAEKKSAEIKLSEQKITSTSKLEDASRQWDNPELELESVSKGSDISEKSATLLFSIPLGGKRSARIDEARAEHRKSLVENQFQVQSSKLSLSLAFYRLSHLSKEIKIAQESVDTFNKIVKQYQSRKALSPEQDVSLEVFKMALSDHQFNLNKLRSESEKIILDLNAITGIEKDVILKHLPTAKSNWIKVGNTESIFNSPQVQLAQAEVELSKSQSERAKADAWPELKIGPTLKETKTEGESEKLAGVSLSMPLPVLSINGGNKDYAREKVRESELSLELSKQKQAAVRKQLIEKYNSTVSILKSVIDSKSIASKHAKIEQQFFKGVVQSSLIIEAHRQLFDLESRRNEAELEALDSLGQLLIIDNKFNEVIL